MISVKNLSKSYELDNGEKIDALKDINLEVKEGEIVGILGTSGSGKTSLLRILRGVDIQSNRIHPNFIIIKLKRKLQSIFKGPLVFGRNL